MRKSIGLRHRAAIAATLAVLVSSGCSSNTSSKSGDTASSGSASASGQPIKVTIASVPGAVVGLPGYVAVDKGFYAAHGLDANIIPVLSGAASAQALIAGSAQIAFNNPDTLLSANDKGQSLKIISGATKGAVTVIAAKKWPLPHAGSYPAVVADLKGARLGVSARGSAIEVWMRTLLTDGGLNPDKDVTFVAAGVGAPALAALQAGQIDALASLESGTTTAVNQLKIADIAVDLRSGQGPKILTDLISGIFASTDQFISGNGEAVKRFVATMTDTVAWMNDPANRKELEGLVAKNLKVDPALIPQLLDANLKTFSALVPRESIDASIKLNKDAKVITGSPTYESLVATQYVPTT